MERRYLLRTQVVTCSVALYLSCVNAVASGSLTEPLAALNYTTEQHFAAKLHKYNAPVLATDSPDPAQLFGVLYIQVFATESLRHGKVKLSGGLDSGFKEACVGCSVWIHQSYSCQQGLLDSAWLGKNGSQLWGQQFDTGHTLEAVEPAHPNVYALPGRAVVVKRGSGEVFACGRIKPIVSPSANFAEATFQPLNVTRADALFLFYEGFEPLGATSFGNVYVSRVEEDSRSVEIEWDLKNLGANAAGDIMVNFDHKCFHRPESLVNVTIVSTDLVHWESDAEGRSVGSAIVDLESKGSSFSTFEALVELTFVVRREDKQLPIACGNLIYTPNSSGYLYAVDDLDSGGVRFRGSVMNLEAVHEFGFQGVTWGITRGTSCANPGFTSTVPSERWKTPYAISVSADGSRRVAQFNHVSPVNIFDSGGEVAYLEHDVVLKSSNNARTACKRENHVL